MMKQKRNYYVKFGRNSGWKACLLVRDVVDCVVSGEGIPVHLKTNGDFVILRRKFSCQ